MSDAFFHRLAPWILGSVLLGRAGSAQGASCANLAARLEAFNKTDKYADAAQLSIAACSERLPQLLLLQGWALLRHGYQLQVKGQVKAAADSAERSISLLDRYLKRSPNLDAQDRMDANTFLSWSQALLRLQGHLRERRFTTAEEVVVEVQKSGKQGKYRRDDALMTVLQAQVLLQRAQAQIPTRWLLSRAGAVQAEQARADAGHAWVLCESLPLSAQVRLRAQREVCIRHAQELGRAAGEAIQQRRHRQRQAAGTTGLVLGLTGLAVLVAGGILYGVDGHQTCAKANLGHCASAWDTRLPGTTLLGVGGSLAGVGLITWGIARGLDARRDTVEGHSFTLAIAGRF